MAVARAGKKIVLGTRGSELALTQARMVAARLRENCGMEVELETIRAHGDEVIPSAAGDGGAGRKGIFTAELERALLEERIDAAVHSAKDLPSEMDAALVIGAVLARASAEDLLVSRTAANFDSLPEEARMATGSIRRRRQLRWQRANIQLFDLRGNVPTRLRKFIASDWDGIVLARAGLERLGFLPPKFEFEGQTFFAEILPVETFVPAGGQGIIALQTRVEDATQFDAIDHRATHACLEAEREFLRLLEGGCDLPVGVYARFVSESEMEMRAQLFGDERAPKMEMARGLDPRRLAEELFQKIDHDHEQEHD